VRFCRFSWLAIPSIVRPRSDTLVLFDPDRKLHHIEQEQKLKCIDAVLNMSCKWLLLEIAFSTSPAYHLQSLFLLWCDRIHRRPSNWNRLPLLIVVDIWSTLRLALDSSRFAKVLQEQYCSRMKTIVITTMIRCHYIFAALATADFCTSKMKQLSFNQCI